MRKLEEAKAYLVIQFEMVDEALRMKRSLQDEIGQLEEKLLDEKAQAAQHLQEVIHQHQCELRSNTHTRPFLPLHSPSDCRILLVVTAARS